MESRLFAGLVIAGGIGALIYALGRPSGAGQKPAAGQDAPDPGALPPSANATPTGSFQVALGVGAKGGAPAGTIQFPTADAAIAYFDATLPIVKAKFAAQGGALALTGPAVKARLEIWEPAVAKPIIPKPDFPVGRRPVI